MDEIRHTPEWKEIYPRRKESIERVFADCKEHHTLRYTRLRGLQKNQHQSLMIFACHNLKRMSKWRWKNLSKTVEKLIKDIIFRCFNEKEKRYFFIKYHFVNNLKNVSSQIHFLCNQFEEINTSNSKKTALFKLFFPIFICKFLIFGMYF